MKTIFTDIIHIGDPFILADKPSKTYYMYATSSSQGFIVWQSKNLVDWEKVGLCYDKSTSNAFGQDCFWAPEVIYNENTGLYVMHYTSRIKTSENNGVLKLGVATSKSPLGPFIDVYGKPMFDLGESKATIDGSCFVEGEKAYLYYSLDCSKNVVNGVHTSQIYCVMLDDTYTKTVGEHYLITTPDRDWEYEDGHPYHWNEGPFAIKHNGKIYLSYSANCYAGKYYCVGVATSLNPICGFVKQNKPTVSFIQGQTSGPGHNMFFTDFSGNLWCCYHIHTDINKPSGDRRAVLSPARFDGDKLVVEY